MTKYWEIKYIVLITYTIYIHQKNDI